MKDSRIFIGVFLSIISVLPMSIYGEDYAVELSSSQSQYLSCASNASLDINSSNASGFTIEMWINRKSSMPGTAETLYSKFRNVGQWDNGYHFQIIDNKLFFYVSDFLTSYQIASNIDISANTWHHAACVIDNKDGKGYLFLDGINISTDSVVLPATAGIASYIGRNSLGGEYTSAIIDEVRISSTARYTANFTPAAAPFNADPYTKALWHFTEGAGSTTVDASGNNNTAALNNNPKWVQGYFSSGSTPSITVTSPNGGETWQTGATQTVAWISQGNVGSVDIQISTSGTLGPWVNIFTNTANTGASSLTCPSLISSACRIKVSGPGGFPFDISDSNFIIISSWTQSNTPPDAPADLKCNNLVNPGGINDFSPDLSWAFSDPDTGDTQSAYRILVADSLSDINNNNGNIWNTDKVISNSNIVTYTGANQLLQGDTYYWKVMAWDTRDSSSAYSTYAVFSMSSGTIPPGITVIYPNGGEIWQAGSAQSVAWISQGNVGNVDIQISTSGTLGPWINVAMNTANDGSESVTAAGYESSDCRIRVQEPAGSPADISNNSFTILSPALNPVINVNKQTLNFGEIAVGLKQERSFDITNTGTGALTGTIISDSLWLTAEPSTFSLNPNNSRTITVTADNNILKQKQGAQNGKLTIISNTVPAQDIDILIEFTATCVIAKPNPFNPGAETLVFFGDGIVPDDTTIRIFSLDGTIVKILKNTFKWNGADESGKPAGNGIYLYTYESPKEKGIGKLTLLRK